MIKAENNEKSGKSGKIFRNYGRVKAHVDSSEWKIQCKIPIESLYIEYILGLLRVKEHDFLMKRDE